MDCVVKMIIDLFVLAEKCTEEMTENERMIMTKDDDRNFKNANTCHICCKDLERHKDGYNIKVRDHDHRSGRRAGWCQRSGAA